MAARDPDAFRSLYRANHRAVCRYLTARAPAGQVEDLAADVFLVAWRRAARVPAAEPLPWLLAVARKLLANQRRATQRGEALAARLADVARLQAPGPDVALERRRARWAVLKALASLREEDRELVLLSVWDDLRPREIAVIFGTSPVVARARASRARRRLQRALTAELDGAAAACTPNLHPDPELSL